MADPRAAEAEDDSTPDSRLVIPMKWLSGDRPADRAERPSEPRRVIDVDAAPVDSPSPDAPARPQAPRLVFSPPVEGAPVPAAEASVPTALAGWAHVISTSPDACLLVDCAGRVLAASFAAAELLGDVTPDEMVGRHLLDGILHFADFDAGKRGVDRGPTYADRIPPLLAVATEAPARGLLRITSRSGEMRMVDAMAAPVHDPAGTVLGAVSFVAALSFD